MKTDHPLPQRAETLKREVRAYWDHEPCGTRGVASDDRRAFFDQIEMERYTWEPYIPGFARFDEARGEQVLEIGIGAGTDFVNWTRNGAHATGVDLTDGAVALTREHLALEGLTAAVLVSDAENLPFKESSFDLVYAYGVLHHSPDTGKAIAEVHRVLKPGKRARIMIYHHPSWTSLMLWVLHCLLRLRPWRSPREAVSEYLESPGTKSYTERETERLFRMFGHVTMRTQLTHGDLLLMRPREGYLGIGPAIARSLYPRWLVRRLGNKLGLALLIEATK